MPRRQERPTLERGLERSAPVPSRLLIAANRLPLSVRVHQGEPELTASTGGLATGLRSPHEQGEGLWFGWPGPLTGLRARGRQRALAGMRERRFVPIELDAAEIEGFYNQFCNGVLWPVCHYLLDRLPLQGADWLTYRAVNERFAAAIAAEWRPGDLIWVHDFHLLLLPALLRERLPNARIGFFLHVPFPSSEVFRVLPWRDELLRGLLGADLIGFHTLGYLRHFAASLLRQLGFEVDIDRLLVDGREVRLTASPMGIDVAAFDQLTADPEVRAEAAAMRVQRGNGQLVLGIDRLDYTKGIPRRLLAFERLLEQRPTTAPPVQLMLVAAASREEVPEYRSFKRTVDELVGRINGRFGAPGSVPIHYINRSLDLRAVTTLYLAADVMLVTPLRDGLNLVAKEFVAARADDDGVLVLSEFAGVAAELADALPFNPYDVDGAAEALARALAMPPEERRQRMRSMRSAVRRHDVHGWVQSFLAELAQATPAIPTSFDYPAANAALAAVRRPLCLLLDYDGTLVDFSPHPDQGAPDNALRTLLQQSTPASGQRPAAHLPRTPLRRAGDRPAWRARRRVPARPRSGVAGRSSDHGLARTGAGAAGPHRWPHTGGRSRGEGTLARIPLPPRRSRVRSRRRQGTATALARIARQHRGDGGRRRSGARDPAAGGSQGPGSRTGAAAGTGCQRVRDRRRSHRRGHVRGDACGRDHRARRQQTDDRALSHCRPERGAGATALAACTFTVARRCNGSRSAPHRVVLGHRP
jgi:trehalose 6-phosphate synthase/phosphatase